MNEYDMLAQYFIRGVYVVYRGCNNKHLYCTKPYMLNFEISVVEYGLVICIWMIKASADGVGLGFGISIFFRVKEFVGFELANSSPIFRFGFLFWKHIFLFQNTCGKSSNVGGFNDT